LLIQGQPDGKRPAGKSDDEVVAQSPQGVVPTGIDVTKRQSGEIRVLFDEERPDGGLIDLDLRRRLGHARSFGPGQTPALATDRLHP